jgi:SAM-dependent methyltransferase
MADKVKVSDWSSFTILPYELDEICRDLKGVIHLRQLLISLLKHVVNSSCFDPSKRYELGGRVILKEKVDGDKISFWRVTEVEEAQNPIQGKFQVVVLGQGDGGKVKKMAAGISDPSGFSDRIRPFEDEEELEDFVRRFVDVNWLDLVRAFENSREAWEGKLAYLKPTREVCPVDLLVPLSEAQANELQHLASELKRAITPPEAREHLASVGLLGDLAMCSEEVADFCIAWWFESQGWEAVEHEWLDPSLSSELDRPIRRQPSVPRVFKDEEIYEKREPSSDEEKQFLEEIGEGELTEEEYLSWEEWRERRQTAPLKLQPLTWQLAQEAYIPMTKALSGFLPPGKLVCVQVQVMEGDPIPFIVSRTEHRGLKALGGYEEQFQRELKSYGIVPGTYLWLQRISDRVYRLFARELSGPRIVKQCKLASIEKGELIFEFEDIPIRWESDPHIFKADLRFVDQDALWEEARKVGRRIATIVRHVFEKLDPQGEGLHWTEVFNATYLIRMCSPRTVSGILYSQPCFESLGNRRFRLNPGIPLQKLSSKRVRRVRPSLQIDIPSPVFPEKSFIARIIAKYCREVFLEYSQDGRTWKTIGQQVANPRGQRTCRFNHSFEKAGHWYIRARAVTLQGRSITRSQTVKVLKPPEPLLPTEITTLDMVELPISLSSVCYPIPFSDSPLSKELQALLDDLHGSVFPMEISPAMADEILQELYADSTRKRYVTPREVVDLMVNLAQPQPEECVADICCGTGIFLVKAWRFVKEVYGEKAKLYLFGADIEPLAIEATYINLKANDAVEALLDERNSLNGSKGLLEPVDLILGNPPFDNEIEYRFLRKWLKLLKEGGRMVVNVPDGVLAGSKSRWIREEIFSRYTVLAIINLPHPQNTRRYGRKSNVLILRKTTPPSDHHTLLINIEDCNQFPAVLKFLQEVSSR